MSARGRGHPWQTYLLTNSLSSEGLTGLRTKRDALESSPLCFLMKVNLASKLGSSVEAEVLSNVSLT